MKPKGQQEIIECFHYTLMNMYKQRKQIIRLEKYEKVKLNKILPVREKQSSSLVEPISLNLESGQGIQVSAPAEL